MTEVSNVDFFSKVELTHKLLKPFNLAKDNLEILYDEKMLKKNYRNKVTYSFNGNEGNMSFGYGNTIQLISLDHISIIQNLADLDNIRFIKDIFIKSNSRDQLQLCFTIYNKKYGLINSEDFLSGIIDKLVGDIVSIYYREYNDETKSLFNIKEIEQKEFRGSGKLEEEILGLKLYFQPYTFSRINNQVSPQIYRKVLELESEIGKNFNHIILYGRDIYYLYKKKMIENAKFLGEGRGNILAITHCKITYQDIISDVDLHKLDFKNLICCNKKDYVKNLALSKQNHKWNSSLVILTAGRNGLSRDLVDYFIQTVEIKYIIYIACNRNTMCRDLAILKVKFKLTKSVVCDEFPLTEYNNTILLLETFEEILISNKKV